MKRQKAQMDAPLFRRNKALGCCFGCMGWIRSFSTELVPGLVKNNRVHRAQMHATWMRQFCAAIAGREPDDAGLLPPPITPEPPNLPEFNKPEIPKRKPRGRRDEPHEINKSGDEL